MVQLNLLPDVKLDYIKAQRSSRLVLTISILATAAALIILGLSFSVNLAQKKHLSDLNKDIASERSTLQQKPDIDKILTVQNQLESLTALHAGKPASSRLFNNYLNQITPVKVAITSFHIDFTANTATITGTADSLATVNKYVDTLKFTTYTTDQNSQAQNAFSNIVLSSFGLNTTATDKSQAASYTITLGYDKTIFDITQNVTLSVPSEVTTRSQIDQPGDLFKDAPASTTTTKSSGGGQ